MTVHRAATAIAVATIALTAGLSVAPSARASADHRKVTAGETVFRHRKYQKLRAAYAVRPSTIALLEPYNREVVALRWSAWSGRGARFR